MAVVEGTLPVGITDKALDTTVVEQTDGTEVHREVVVNGDPETLEALARVGITTNQFIDYGLVVREPQQDDVVTALNAIIDELREMKMHLSLLTEINQ